MRTARIALATALAAGAVLLPSAGASATTSDPGGPAFGRHVSECAKTVGFSATHNPGMHQGRSASTGMGMGGTMPMH